MRHVTLTLIALAALCGCREGVGAPQPTAAPVAEGSATAPAFTRGAAAEAPALAAAKPAEPSAEEIAPAPGEDADQLPEGAEDGEPAAEKDSEATAEAEDDAEEGPTKPASLSPTDGVVPAVDVQNVGMHIGGAKNTAEEKRPIRAAVSPHYDGLKRCYAKADSPAKDATFGVDLRIPGAGGAAKVTKPRSGLKGDGVTECMVSVFEAIEFPRQPHGQPRMVSYSVRFRKK